VTIDPETWNTRAIRSYERAGFAKWRFLPRAELHEGEWRDVWLMVFGLPAPRVARLDELPFAELASVAQEAEVQGFEFVRKLISEYHSGANRFDKPGEALFAVYDDDGLIGVGGLNVDHYAHDPRVGRVRHVYVLASHRRCGAGRALVTAIMTSAMTSFDVLRLRTNTPEGARFYESLGFEQLKNDADATHSVRFGSAPLP
jgi:GNAT superfamily N-acetyltransferase